MIGLLRFFYILLHCCFVIGTNQLPQPGECGTANAAYINNGKNVTELDEFPWLGRIAYITNETVQPIFRCGTILINQRYLLTNANCFRFTAQPDAVILGDWNAANNINEVDCDDSERCAPLPKYYEIEEITIHNNYNRKSFANNIALIRLNESVTYTDYIRPICMPSNLTVPQQLFAPEHLQLSGWLKVDSDDVAYMKKSKMFVKVITLEECNNLYRFSNNRTLRNTSNICAFTCAGRSKYLGSSALMGLAKLNEEPAHYYLAGMVAFGRPECSYTYPDIFTSVDEHLDWIKANLFE